MVLKTLIFWFARISESQTSFGLLTKKKNARNNYSIINIYLTCSGIGDKILPQSQLPLKGLNLEAGLFPFLGLNCK